MIIWISRLSLIDPISDDFFLTSRFGCSVDEDFVWLKQKKLVAKIRKKLTHQQKMEKWKIGKNLKK